MNHYLIFFIGFVVGIIATLLVLLVIGSHLDKKEKEIYSNYKKNILKNNLK